MAVPAVRKWTAYAAGKKVYRSGSSAPTQGRVNPTGYVERSLASTSRSGLASAALRRIQSAKTALSPTPAVKDVRVPTTSNWYPTVNVKPTATGALLATPVQKAKVAAKPVNPTKSVVNKAHTAATSAGRTVTRSTDQLANISKSLAGNKAYAASQADTALPFDAQASDQRARALRDKNEYLAQLEEAISNEAEKYTTGRRSTEEIEPGRLRQLLNAYAGRGMAFSSGYGQAYGDEQRGFANRLAALESAHTEAGTGFEKNRSKYERDYSDKLQDIFWDQARRLTEKAGETGFAEAVKKEKTDRRTKSIADATKAGKVAIARKPAPKKPTVTPRSRAIATAAKRRVAVKGKK